MGRTLTRSQLTALNRQLETEIDDLEKERSSLKTQLRLKCTAYGKDAVEEGLNDAQSQLVHTFIKELQPSSDASSANSKTQILQHLSKKVIEHASGGLWKDVSNRFRFWKTSYNREHLVLYILEYEALTTRTSLIKRRRP